MYKNRIMFGFYFRTKFVLLSYTTIMVRFINEIKTHPINFAKTCALYASVMFMGMGFAIIGPTLLDLKTQTGRELNEVAIILPASFRQL